MPVDLRQSLPADIEWLVELRARVLRDDLERLGRFDPVRVRKRMRDAFAPEHTRVLVAADRDIGSITVRPDGGVRWIEHFYVAEEAQRRGIGSAVLRRVLAEPFDGITRLNVLQGSAARSLYHRHGFVADSEDDVDVFMTHRPQLAG